MQVLKSNTLGSAQEPDQTPLVATVTKLDSVDRWTVYRRLQELGMTCRYGRDAQPTPCQNRPMTVSVHTPTEALLVWSVVQTVTASRLQLADHLDRCWQQRSPA